ncbi:predicted protein [Nematostella vectensis]|uniref:G-protein coupled receptors family 2 profile 2 domain-containing protein n=1 Tax=Nematostella vectensis TaxID=45351 RepID=A7SFI6_NEMVE|nr:predicted protein [Nematostella vectensis]|eukprot:XP_001629533.1 predicted protein [Nematostella vectensis]
MTLKLCLHFTVGNTSVSSEDLRNQTLYMFGNCFFEIPSLTCLGRCEVHSERFQIETLCYCDSICLQIGDCCHDYRKVCKAKLSEKPQVKQVCSNHYIVTNSCPKGTDQYLDGLCSETHGEILRRPYDLLRNLHVFDHDKNISYRNVFCARCNGARNTSYWTTTADCSTTANLSSIKDNLLSFVRNNCTILMGMPKTSGIIEGRLCKERHHAFTNSYGHNKVKECRKYCEKYSLPVVVLDLNRFSCTIYKNPHCALLQGVRIDKLSCRRCPFGAHPHIPDLRILFNFQSTGTTLKLNDLGVLLSNASYFVSGDVIVVCIQSEGQAGGSEGLHRSGDRVVLGIMTCIGCSISVLALLVLLVIYARFPELRNLPGKIQMNLSVALLAFHVLFFMVAMSTSGALCKAIAIGIHYFLFVGFAWMAVMAYDVHRTFTGQTEAILQPQRSMLVYSCLSWLLPAAFVGASVVIDLTVPGAIDYGKGEFCYITSRFGLIFAFLVPVSLVLSWNILSLARTLFYIRLARKYSDDNQRRTALKIMWYLESILGFRDGQPSNTWQIDYLSSSSSITTTKLARPSCETSQVYDPFRGVCRVVYSPDKLTDHHGNSNNSSAFHTTSFVHHRHDNCTHVTYNKTDITIYGNSTLKLNDLGVLLSNASYFVSGDVIVVCIQSEGQAGGSEGLHRSGDRVVLGIMTCIGCSISVLALLVLLVIYARFPELRNLPGKIQMNLSVALLAFHVLFFMVAMSTSGALCKAIAIGIHYFLLVGFAWMAVMAYDVHRTFTGQTEAILQPQRSMLVYSCLSWLLPAAFVGAIVVIDLTVPGAIDYGKGEFCYITSRFGLIFAFLVPVSLVLSWNILSLARTLFYIRLARKAARGLRTSSGNQNNILPIMCMKLTSVLGLPWTFGVLASLFPSCLALWIVYTAFNSLQGFFMLLSFLS